MHGARTVAAFSLDMGCHVEPECTFREKPCSGVVATTLLAMGIRTIRTLHAHVFDCMQGAPYSLERTLLVLLGVARALDSARRDGVIHMDLKPENVLLRDGHHAVVLDWGCAEEVGGIGPRVHSHISQHRL